MYIILDIIKTPNATDGTATNGELVAVNLVNDHVSMTRSAVLKVY